MALKGFLARKDRGRMTSAEEFVAAIGSRFGLVFVGGGDLVVGYKVPDFCVEGTKKLVEVWDLSQTDRMKRDDEWRRRRQSAYEDEGYEVLFLPVSPMPLSAATGSRKPEVRVRRDAEVDRVETILSEYVRNGSVVRSLVEVTPESNPKAWVRLAGQLQNELMVYNLEVEGTHTYVANQMVVHNCDTEYTANRELMSPSEVVSAVYAAGPTFRPLVVITGGEPFRQDLTSLVLALIKSGHHVQVETNGTLQLPPELMSWIDEWNDPQIFCVVCSPKTQKIHQANWPYINALKYVVQQGQVDTDGLPLSSVGPQYGRPARPPEDWAGKIYVQPLDEQDAIANDLNMQVAVKSCMKYGFRLCLQTHKIARLP